MKLIRAKKSLGQNFLVNDGVLENIIRAAELSADDTVIEIGPGTGLLTRKLVASSAKIICIEKDSRLIGTLHNEFPGIQLIEGDILEWIPKDITPEKYKIIANIPYYITSHLLRNIFEKWPKPSLVVLTVQKEVAKRIIAKPPQMNLLALSVQYFSEPEITGYISKGSFRPVPKVDSAIIKLRPKPVIIGGLKAERLFNLMRTGFSSKRKQLASLLAEKYGQPKEEISSLLISIGLKGDCRAENLTLYQWVRLADDLLVE